MVNHVDSEQSVDMPVERSDISVIQIIFDRNIGKIQTNNYNMTKREFLEMLQLLTIKITKELIEDQVSSPKQEEGL